MRQMDSICNKTFDEIQIGETVSLTRTLTKNDLSLFSVMTGNLNPLHLDEDLAAKELDHHKLVGHGAWVSALISNLLGNQIPGPGTIYKSLSCTYQHHVELGDTIDLVMTVKQKNPQNNEVIFECEAKNHKNIVLMNAQVIAVAPTKKICVPRPAMPEIKIRPKHHIFEDLLEKCKTLEPISMAVCHPCDKPSLLGAVNAAKAGLIKPVLVGPKELILAVAKECNVDISPYEILHTNHFTESAVQSVALCRNQKTEALMKGSLHTDELMREVTSKETGLRSSRRISHVYVMSVPTYPKPLLITDAGINIHPTLEDKVDICQNAIDLAIVVGIEVPRVAILSAVETVYPKITSTIDAAALCKMADRGQIRGAILDGPLAFDNAISFEAAKIKKINSPVAGQADILVVPDLEAGNILAKQLDYLAEAATAGIVLGARVPIVLTSRAESPKVRLTSCALAMLAAHARRQRKSIGSVQSV